MDASPQPSGALCPNHPDRPAAATCARCGLFLCTECTVATTPPVCRGCYERQLAASLTRRTYSFGQAFATGFALFRKQLGFLAGLSALFAAPEGLLALLPIPEQLTNAVSNVYSATVGLLVVVGSLAAAEEHAEGRQPTWRGILDKAFANWGRVFGARLLAGIKVALWSLLLIVPGLIRWSQLAVVTQAAFVEPGTDALARSDELTFGRRWSLFGLMIAANALTLGLFAIPGFALGAIAGVAPLASVPVGIVSAWLLGGLIAFPELVMLGAYYGLRHSQTLASQSEDGL